LADILDEEGGRHGCGREEVVSRQEEGDTEGIYIISTRRCFQHLNPSNAYVEGRRE
jgi:hypothetical protein